MSFRLEQAGRLTDVRIERSDSEQLAESCLSAMQAAQIPSVPENVGILVGKRIVATFVFTRDSP